jgi:NitT/TauT family transport system ATP-binding protein
MAGSGAAAVAAGSGNAAGGNAAATGEAPGATPTPALAFDRITCAFAARGTVPGAAAGRYVAVENASLSVGPGEFVSVVGPTGCGKSTLLNVAAGLLAPTSGELRVFGKPLAGINRDAGYLFQAEALMPWRSALANVTAGLEFRGVARAEAEPRARDWLARVGLSGFEDRYPHQLSGGMRKRVALAQVLILDPKILLMDEPFSALDVQTRQLMENELLDLWSADRKSVLFITHDLEEAISLSDRVVVLSAGPATRPIGEFVIDLPRPRDVSEIRMTPRFVALHEAIWHAMKDEVLKAYARGRREGANEAGAAHG